MEILFLSCYRNFPVVRYNLAGVVELKWKLGTPGFKPFGPLGQVGRMKGENCLLSHLGGCPSPHPF